MDVVMNISTKITVLNFGAKIAEGTPYEIQNNDGNLSALISATNTSRWRVSLWLC